MVGDIRWSSCTVGWLRLRGRLVRLISRELLITGDWLANPSTIKRNIKEA